MIISFAALSKIFFLFLPSFRISELYNFVGYEVSVPPSALNQSVILRYSGFGYAPIFLPVGYDRTFGQMSIIENSHISHRGKAVNKFHKFLYKQ